MVNTMYHGARIVAPANAPTEEPAARGHGQGKGRERSRCRIYGRVAAVVNEVPNDHVLGNETLRHMRR